MKTAESAAFSSADIFQLIEPELRDVEVRLKTEAISNLRLVGEMNRYLHESGGKRLRPSLLLLVSKMFGVEREAALRLGVVVELIHVATLVHDDIIDNAGIRRGKPSINAKWGNEVTVLFGDWLYMTAFWIALKEQDFKILDILIDITRTMVEGELIQLEQNHHLDITIEEYLDICWHKTAHLFSGCSRLGAVLGKADKVTEKRLAEFGRSLGMAFQLTDDLLDYTSNERVLGKPVLKDLEEGNITLPIISLLKKANNAETRFVRSVVENRDFSDRNKQKIIDLINGYGTLGELKDMADKFAGQAVSELASLPKSLYRDALIELPNLIISRQK